MNEAPVTHEDTVIADWIDYNGHMNVAYYMLVFDRAIDVVLNRLGLNAKYREDSGCTLFAVESHITYGQELFEGDPIVIRSRILGSDDKRLHLFFHMYGGKTGDQAATLETMLLHINAVQRRAALFPSSILETLKTGGGFRLDAPLPAEVGRVMMVKSG